MRRWDEKVPANFGFAQSLFNFYNKPLNETLFEAQTKVIREIGEKGNCVIVGRNANTILKEFDGGLHIFVHASPYWRMTVSYTHLSSGSAGYCEQRYAGGRGIIRSCGII